MASYQNVNISSKNQNLFTLRLLHFIQVIYLSVLNTDNTDGINSLRLFSMVSIWRGKLTPLYGQKSDNF